MYTLSIACPSENRTRAHSPSLSSKDTWRCVAQMINCWEACLFICIWDFPASRSALLYNIGSDTGRTFDTWRERCEEERRVDSALHSRCESGVLLLPRLWLVCRSGHPSRRLSKARWKPNSVTDCFVAFNHARMLNIF